MSYVNRETADGLGYRAAVSLSGELAEYPATLITAKYCFAPVFRGFGLEAKLKVDAYMIGAYTMSLCAPVWQVFDSGGLVLEIPGLEAELDIAAAPRDLTERLEVEFARDSLGEYVWRGLPKSNLPETEARYYYESGSGWAGTVNGIPFAAEAPGAMSFTVGCNEEPMYGSPAFEPGGAFAGSAALAGGESPRFSYTAEADQNIPGAAMHSRIAMGAGGGSLSIEGEHLINLIDPGVAISMTEPPWSYRYNVTDRPGLSLSAARFSDANGNAWQGAVSPWFSYGGICSVTASGYFNAPGHTETAVPPFDE